MKKPILTWAYTVTHTHTHRHTHDSAYFSLKQRTCIWLWKEKENLDQGQGRAGDFFVPSVNDGEINYPRGGWKFPRTMSNVMGSSRSLEMAKGTAEQGLCIQVTSVLLSKTSVGYERSLKTQVVRSSQIPFSSPSQTPSLSLLLFSTLCVLRKLHYNRWFWL